MKFKRLGILGGGQLGYLIAKEAFNYPISVKILDPNPECTCSVFEGLTVGDFEDFDDVMKFGEDCDVLVAEIEKINTKALRALREKGVKVIPNPNILEIIQDKGKQRMFFTTQGFRSPQYDVVDKADIKKYESSKKVVQKLRKGGYDGKGVFIWEAKDVPSKLIEEDSVIEEFVDIDKEVSVVVCRDARGISKHFEPVEMHFDPKGNLLDYMISPARIDKKLAKKCIDTAVKIGDALEYEGVFAVELFVTKSGEVLVNEVSPRVHNSGHHTIESYSASQYDQMVRIALELNLLELKPLCGAILFNLNAAEDANGDAQFNGLEIGYSDPRIFYTFYGKKKVRPFRKMGHAVMVTEMDVKQSDIDDMMYVKDHITITGND